MKITHAKDDAKVTRYTEDDDLKANTFYLDSAGALVLTDLYGAALVAFYEDQAYPAEDIEYPLVDTKIKKVTVEL